MALVVFDFDHSFIEDNTDTWIMKVRPQLILKQRGPSECWTDYMGYVFDQIHRAGCTKEELLEFVSRLEPFPGLNDALEAIKMSGSKAIIVSDSNSVFIEAILQTQGLRHYFSDVITNPAHFDEAGRLRIQRCHAHSCPRCSRSPNMCKGTLLAEYLSANGPYSHVVYVGDGQGDVCPSLALQSKDVVLARRDYTLAQALGTSTKLKATLQVIDFESELAACLQHHFSATGHK